MVVNHRYLLDAIIDRRRYRYSGPRWLLRFIWRIVPKPDLVLLLDAPPEVIASRKSELPLERRWRDVRVDRIWDGTSEIQRHIIARELLRPLGA